MDAANDPTVQSTVLMWASQVTGKTEVLNNIVGYHIDHRPCPILVLQPRQADGDQWSKDRLATMIRDTPCLRSKVADPKSRDSGNTILHKKFIGGHITIVGANAPSNLAMRPIRVLLCDEISRYTDDAGKEGDPIALATKRTERFSDAVIYMTSTPTIKDMCRVEAEFEITDKRYWFVPCGACGHFQTLKWQQVKWDKDEKGGHLPQTAYYECEKCEARWSDQDRIEAIWKGEWRPTAPFTGRRGYHMNGIYVLFPPHKGFDNRLHEMAEGFLRAKRDAKTLQVWVNTFKAETFEDHVSTVIEPHWVESRAENYGKVLPMGVLGLVGGADVQGDRIEAEIMGIGLEEETWGVQYGVFYGSPESASTWNQLKAFWSQTFPHACGVRLRVVAALIDSGFKPKAVYSFVRLNQGTKWYAAKGSSSPGMPLCSPPRKKSISPVMLHTVGTDTAKDMIYSRLKIPMHGPRYAHFPIGRGYDSKYYDGLTAEKARMVYGKDGVMQRWEKIRERNEPLDCRVYCHAAAEVARFNMEEIAEAFQARGEKPPEPQEQQPRRFSPVRRKGRKAFTY